MRSLKRSNYAELYGKYWSWNATNSYWKFWTWRISFRDFVEGFWAFEIISFSVWLKKFVVLFLYIEKFGYRKKIYKTKDISSSCRFLRNLDLLNASSPKSKGPCLGGRLILWGLWNESSDKIYPEREERESLKYLRSLK